jgi:hypothetical protein
VDTLMLGNVSYTKDQLCSILNQDVRGNCLISLAHQLIAAKLNIANNAPHDCIDATITAVDQLIGDLVVPPVGNDSLPCNISGFIDALDNFNSGKLDCAPHCSQDTAPVIVDNPCIVPSPTPTPTANP